VPADLARECPHRQYITRVLCHERPFALTLGLWRIQR
jgi:hypothetical protein